MLKTVLLLLPMMFNTQAATAQTPVVVPEVQKYCVAIELPNDPRMPEYVESVNEIVEDSIADAPTPVPYFARRNDRRVYGSTSDMNNSATRKGKNNGTSNGTTNYNGTNNGNTNGTTNYNGMNNGNTNGTTNYNGMNNGNTNGTTNYNGMNNGTSNGTTNYNGMNRGTNNGTTNYNGMNSGDTAKDNMGTKNNSDINNSNKNNIVTIDDGTETFSSYNDAYKALKDRFDNMFEMQTGVDELRRELMSKETELKLHQDLYRERLKSLVEKWNRE